MKKSTKTISALLAVVMLMGVVLCAPFTVSALTSGDYEYSVLDDGTAEITGYSGTAEKLEIPGTLDGYTVTGIGEDAFSYLSSLTIITIPDGVTYIDDFAFYNCYGLTGIAIPDSVTSIGLCAFRGCRSLASVNIPAGVTNIESYAFYGCVSLPGINVADNNTMYSSLDGVLFDKSLETLICYPAGKQNTYYTIPNSVTTIRPSAFENCSSLTGVTITDGVTYIGISAFSDCQSLINITATNNNSAYSTLDGVLFDKNFKTLVCYPAGKQDTHYTIPDTVTSIGNSAFYSLNRYLSLTSITIPDSVTSIGSYAFSHLESLTGITIPNTVTTIGNYAFSDCSGLTSVTIPDSVTYIGDSAFEYCSDLTSITIPDSVTTIGDCAFDGCLDLTIYGYENSKAQAYAEENSIDFVILSSKKIIGDVNCDGSVTILDVTVLQKYLANLERFEDKQLAVADADGDGSVSINDVAEIQKYLAHIVNSLG